MTMLDDDRLTSLLAGAAATFEVPDTGAADILERAERPGPRDDDAHDHPDDDPALPGAPDTPGRVHRLVRVAGRHRVLSVAAALVVLLVLAGAVGSSVRSPARPSGRGWAGAPIGHGARSLRPGLHHDDRRQPARPATHRRPARRPPSAPTRGRRDWRATTHRP